MKTKLVSILIWFYLIIDDGHHSFTSLKKHVYFLCEYLLYHFKPLSPIKLLVQKQKQKTCRVAEGNHDVGYGMWISSLHKFPLWMIKDSSKLWNFFAKPYPHYPLTLETNDCKVPPGNFGVNWGSWKITWGNTDGRLAREPGFSLLEKELMNHRKLRS